MIDLQLPTSRGDDFKNIKYFKADVSNTKDVEEATNGIISWSKEARLDVIAVVCCAGYLGPAKVGNFLTTCDQLY